MPCPAPEVHERQRIRADRRGYESCVLAADRVSIGRRLFRIAAAMPPQRSRGYGSKSFQRPSAGNRLPGDQRLFATYISFWPAPLNQPVERRQHKQSQSCRGNDAANNDGCEWTLHLRSGSANVERHRNEPEAGDKRGHQHWTQTRQGAFANCFCRVQGPDHAASE